VKKQLDSANKQNQIQLYKEETAFWLDKEWKTPREKQLEKENEELKEKIEDLKERVDNAASVVSTLLGYGKLSYWCSHCHGIHHATFDEDEKEFTCDNCGKLPF
jgi:hypothetical protein